MNPRDKKLRLRKTTVSSLAPNDGSQVKGGIELQYDPEATNYIGCTLQCSGNMGCPCTRAFTNCAACGDSGQTCYNTCHVSCMSCMYTCNYDCTLIIGGCEGPI